MMNGRLKTGLAGLALVALAALLIWGFLRGRAEADGELEGDASTVAPSRTLLLDGQLTVVFDSAARAHAGLRITVLDSARQSPQLTAYGHVVEVEQLTGLRSRYAAARARAEETRARAEVANREYLRERTLHQDRQIVSAKTLDRTAAVYRAEQAAAEAADHTLHGLGATVREEWGEIIGGWLTDGSPRLDRILSGREVLVQATLPPPATADPPPATALIELPHGGHVRSRLVSPAARTDPRIQGSSFFYVAPSRAGLLPGATVAVLLEAGAPISGGLVPTEAILWHGGREWVYVQVGPNRFTRKPIQTERAVPGGFVVSELAPGTPVVRRGAGLLLSEELRAQIGSGEEGTEP